MQGGRRKGEGGRGKAALRFGRFLAILPLLVAQAGAQTLVVPPTTPPGTPIVAKIEGLPDGARVAWKTSTGAGVVNVGKGRAHLWASGSHTVSAVVALADPNAELIWLDAPFAVDGAPQPPPAPKTLAELAGADAAAIGSRLAALSAVLADIRIESFPAVLAGSLSTWKTNAAVPVIVKRLALPDLAAIGVELKAIIAELGSAPPTPVPPVIVPGKRTVVILHETGDDAPADGQLYVALRQGDFAGYLASHGHTLDVLDDDPESQPERVAALLAKLNALGVTKPAIYVLDAATGEVIHSQPRPATVAEILQVVKSHGG